MHDLNNLESAGLPSLLIASSGFISAAETHAQALGFIPACVFVAHPIQDRTDDEIAALAMGAVDEIVLALTQRRSA